MRVDRRGLLTGALAAGAASLVRGEASAQDAPRPTGEELDRAAARPVLKTDAFKSPVVIESIRLLKKDGEYFVHVRSKDGAEGVSVANPPRPEYPEGQLLHQQRRR